MSLKAKLEAVIYAAEEPVTLAQLAELFAEEALLWSARQRSIAAEEPTAQPLDHPAPLDLSLEDNSSQKQLDDTDENPSPDAGSAAEAVQDDEARRRQEEKQNAREVREVLRQLLDELIHDCRDDSRGIEIREIAGGYRLATKPECHDAVRTFVRSLKPALKLSLPALETLAVVAYKQPVTAPEVAEIRGVDSAGVLGSLISRKLIATAGRKQVVGRPMLYKTTKEFLLRFGLKDISELPSMEEFEKMAALELTETLADSDQPGDLFESAETNAETSVAQIDPRQDARHTAIEAMESDANQPVADPGTEAEQPENALQ